MYHSQHIQPTKLVEPTSFKQLNYFNCRTSANVWQTVGQRLALTQLIKSADILSTQFQSERRAGNYAQQISEAQIVGKIANTVAKIAVHTLEFSSS